MKKKQIKAVLFDLDGVLVDSYRAWFNIFNDTLEHFGKSRLTLDQFSKSWGNPIEKDIDTHFPGKTPQDLIKIYHKSFKKNKDNIKLLPDSSETLVSLHKQKLKIALITNSTKLIATKSLEKFNIKKYFNSILSMEDVENRKPAPDMVLKACTNLQVLPKNSILVGDTHNDMDAGKNAGCITAGFKIKGDHTLNKLTDLLDLIK
tara:strand:+ start:23635 stop:24246 length:612 start_codon:yes stop_codon:yes gene_type:complete